MTAPHKPSAALDYDYEERAAILEFEAGFPRAEAERRAREMQEASGWPRDASGKPLAGMALVSWLREREAKR
jgi:hypothetical protein